VAVLDDAARSHPDSWCRLKADGCDINKGLKESVQQKWSGDVDLNDGQVEKQYEAYQTVPRNLVWRTGIKLKINYKCDRICEKGSSTHIQFINFDNQ